MTISDVVLIGAGPSNLSLAAHLYPAPDIRWRIVERRADPQWHEGMLLPDARLQSSHFKDLIFLSDPGSPFTFFNYLHEKGILYQYIHAEFDTPLRRDFDRYFRWVRRKLGSRVSLGEAAARLDYDDGQFILSTDKRTLRTRNIVLGVGHVPFVPMGELPPRSERIFHSSRYRERKAGITDLRGKSVAIVGGGQSAAEIVLDLICDSANLPRRILWFARGLKFRMFDETVLCNDVYTPEFARFFFEQSADFRQVLNQVYKSSSDGIVADVMLNIFRRFYVLEQEGDGTPDRQVLLGRTIENVQDLDGVVRLTCRESASGGLEHYEADLAILATGYKQDFGALNSSIDTLIQRDASGAPIFERDYRLRLRTNIDGVRIFAQNASLDAYGWVDPNLGGTSYRSSVIANTLLGADHYRNGGCPTFVNWGGNL